MDTKMKTKVTTDWHLSAKRTGGTTPQSQFALKNYLLDSFVAQLDDTDHLVAGDLFDSFTIDTGELIFVYNVISDWVKKYNRKLALVRGNHDWSQRGDQRSSFDLLGHILKSHFPNNVTVADTVTEWKQFILVPHVANNDLLEIEISRLKDVSGKVVVFHANADNFHAKDSQHSLDVSRADIDFLCEKNVLIFGHEHPHRKLNGGKCLVLGNAVPSSISDCVACPVKYSATFDGLDYTLASIWSGGYLELDWRELSGNAQFIRVTGSASAAEAAHVVSAVAKFRQKSSAFVVASSVLIEGVATFEEIEKQTMESVRAFDVLSAILSELDEREKVAVEGLLS